MTDIELNAPVYPSEDPEKIISAIKRIFPDAELEDKGDEIRGTSHSMEKFSKQIRKEKILDTTRSMMIRGKRGNVTRFFLNKQVATVGKVSFTEEKTILGSIRVVITDEELTALIDTVAPVTVDGEEVLI